MSILSRYIVRQHIGPFVFGFSIITLIFILNLLFKELNRILSKGLPAHVIIEFFALNMAWIIALAVPMAMLTASLMAFGRLSADNEITAIKASGISLYRILTPALVTAAVLAIALTWFNNAVLPDFNHRLRLLMSDIARKKPTINIEPGVWYDELTNYGLIVRTLEDSSGIARVGDILINDYHDPNIVTTITARRGYIHVSEAEGLLEMSLFDGEMQEINIKKLSEFRSLRFPRHIVRIDIADMFLKRSDSEYRGDREKSANMMRDEVKRLDADIVEQKKAITTLVGEQFNRNFNNAFAHFFPKAADSSGTSAARRGPGELRLGSLNRPAAKPDASPPLPPRTDTEQKNDRLAHDIRMLSQERTVLSQIQMKINHLNNSERQKTRLLVEIYKKYSIPVACIVFALIGAPLGIMARSGSMAVGGGVSLSFFLLYWISLISGEDLADRGMLSPFLAMWLANILVGAGGIYLLLISVRESRFIRFDTLSTYLAFKFRRQNHG